METFLQNDNIWLNDSLNWDDVFDLTVSDLTVWSFFITPFFKNSNFFTDFITKISFLDNFLVFGVKPSDHARELYDFFLWDMMQSLSNKFAWTRLLYFTDHQDSILIIARHNPEAIAPLLDFCNLLTKYTSNFVPAALSDIIADSIEYTTPMMGQFCIAFVIFMWGFIIIANVFRFFNWDKAVEGSYIRFSMFVLSMSREVRAQFEATLQVVFLFLFYWTMSIAALDDDREEVTELMDTGFFYFFCIIILYLLFKYSIHYFAFLEASVVEGRSLSFIAKQFLRDGINTFALFLRFFVLLFRLNVYDTLDDFYDSYYIYVGDFDDDEYYNELFFSIFSLVFYDFDPNSDKLFSLEEESDLFLDLFYFYFICWAKFFTFIFFIVEEILRLSLAFYISYLIVFEVHAVNFSYTEDKSFNKTPLN